MFITVNSLNRKRIGDNMSNNNISIWAYVDGNDPNNVSYLLSTRALLGKYIINSNETPDIDQGNTQVIIEIKPENLPAVALLFENKNFINLYGILRSGIFFDGRFLGWKETDKEHNPANKKHKKTLQEVWKSLRKRFGAKLFS